MRRRKWVISDGKSIILILSLVAGNLRFSIRPSLRDREFECYRRQLWQLWNSHLDFVFVFFFFADFARRFLTLERILRRFLRRAPLKLDNSNLTLSKFKMNPHFSGSFSMKNPNPSSKNFFGLMLKIWLQSENFRPAQILQIFLIIWFFFDEISK